MIPRERRRAWAEENRLRRAGVSPDVAAILAGYAAPARERAQARIRRAQARPGVDVSTRRTPSADSH